MLTRSLHDERHGVAANENLRHPPAPDHQVFVAFDELHNAVELHVDGRREQRRRDEEEETLEGVRAGRPLAMVLRRGHRSPRITHNFHYKGRQDMC